MILLTSVSSADVSVTKEKYRVWDDAIKISNGTVDVIVVPQIGRIMSYGYTAKENILWEDLSLDRSSEKAKSWVNWGGDKVWTAPQSVWNWPPDKVLDGSPFKAEILKDGVRISSGTGNIVQVKVVREVHLKPFGTEVNITNKIENLGATRQISSWQVTQVKEPTQVELPITFGGTMPSGFITQQNSKFDPKYHTVLPGKLVIKRDPKAAHKFGARSTGSIFATINGLTFETYSKVEKRATYPDADSAQEVFTNAGNDAYVELELLSPLVNLEPRQVILQQVRWRITGG